MKKFNLLKFGLALTVLASPLLSSAQNDMLKFETNFYKDYVGDRIIVASPVNLAKELKYTISNDGSGGANEWGGEIPAAGMLNKELIKATPYDACNPVSNNLTGKIALVYRGSCEFSQKAEAVEHAINGGAIACIIVNNIDGGPVGMGAGSAAANVSIPVIMISKAEGLILSDALDNGQTVTMSLTKWGNNLTNDIGIVNSGTTQWHEYAIPVGQVKSAGALSKPAYKAINGAVIANFGTADQTGVKLVTTVSWTPTGGSATVIHKDSVENITINALDSIKTPYAAPYELPATTTTGRFDVTHTVSMTNADDFPNDNTVSTSFHVTGNVLSKGRYDFTTGMPISTVSYAFANSTDFIWGPLHYIAKGGYQVTDVQFAISKSGDTDLSNTQDVSVFIWKWKDGLNGMPMDGVIQAGEVNQIGLASKSFVAGDTGGQVFTCKVVDNNDNTKPVITEDDTWYWVTVSVPLDHFLACDGELNYYPRSFGMFKSSLAFNEYHQPLFQGTDGSFTNTNGNEASMYPFEATNNLDSVRFSQQSKGTVPSVPFLMSIHPVSVNDMVIEGSRTNVDIYPNPASDVLNVSVKQDKISDRIAYTVLDAAGKIISSVTHNNVQNDTYSIQTSKLPAGNYFLVVNANGKPTSRTFTVIK